MNTEIIDPQNLKYFTRFQNFTDKQLQYISSHSTIKTILRNQVLLDLNSVSTDEFFLLEGSLHLLSTDGASRVIETNTDNVKLAIAQLRPSRYKVTAMTTSKVLIFPEDVRDQVLSDFEEPASEPMEITENELDEADQILCELIIELQQGDFILPTLPSIAMKIREVIAQDESSANDISKVIMGDPVIAAKIMKAANSAMYQRQSKAEDCKTAIVGLGMQVTSQLVTAFAMQELFNSPNKKLMKHMNEFWEHSIEIASISSFLAKLTPGIGPDQALLAGLVHDIGNVAILNKALEYPDIIDSDEKITRLLAKTSNLVSSSILQSWSFSDEMVEMAKETEDWMRTGRGSGMPDMTDIINIAHLHSYIGTEKQKTVPIIDQIPAFKKMALGKLTPELSMDVLRESKKQIDDIKSIFKA